MREILFRGKRLDNGEWIYGSLLNFGGEYEISDCNTVDYSRYEVDPSTVGQYTGMQDIGGEKIFEGDVVNVLFGATCSVLMMVHQYRGAWCITEIDGDTETNHLLSDYMVRIHTNIHDNPELLK